MLALNRVIFKGWLPSSGLKILGDNPQIPSTAILYGGMLGNEERNSGLGKERSD